MINNEGLIMINKNELSAKTLFDSSHTVSWELLMSFTYPWEALPHIKDFILNFGKELNEAEYDMRDNNIWIHKTAVIAASAHIGSNVIVGPDTHVIHCAYIRDNVLIGKGAKIGNSTELKNVILFDNVQVPHYNYVGDSILGYKAHFGAGVITSNVKSDSSPVSVTYNNEKINTGLKKFGAIVGDRVEVGCNAVLNPGTVVGKDTNIYPLSSVRGYIAPDSIYKSKSEIVRKH
jgi:NDP-sugar pyrophosphorylase family protein